MNDKKEESGEVIQVVKKRLAHLMSVKSLVTLVLTGIFAYLVQDCQGAADAVDKPSHCPVTSVLNANQRDALISFTFNCGVGNLRTLCRNRSLPQICEAMALYNKGNGGQVLQGLVRRRKAEDLFNAPVDSEEVEEVRYNTVEECPAWGRETVQKLVDKGYLGGNGQGLDLSMDMVRLLVILDRAGNL